MQKVHHKQIFSYEYVKFSPSYFLISGRFNYMFVFKQCKITQCIIQATKRFCIVLISMLYDVK